MKIAIVRRRYDPLGGGAERYSHRLVEGLINKGYSVTVYAEKFSNVPDEVKLVKVPKAFFTLCKTAAFAKKTAKILNRDEYDVVVALSRFLGADIYRQAEQIHKYWLEEIGYVKGYSLNPRHLGILEIERQLFKVENTTQVVTNSNLIKEQIVGLFNYPEDRVNVIYNGLDKSVFYRYNSNKVKDDLLSEFNVPKGSNVLSLVAYNFDIKGVKEAICSIFALPQDLKSKTYLFVVGGGDIPTFKKLAESMGLGKQIIFVGKSGRVADFFNSSDLFLFPTMYEPFANVCLEATACGLPVLTTLENGFSGLISDGENGFTVPRASDVELIKEKIETFFRLSKGERCKLSEQAEAIANGFSWEKHCSEFIDLIEITAESKKNGN